MLRGVSVTIDELRERFGLSRKTINQYVWKGILPPPAGGRGPAARYGLRHVEILEGLQALNHTRTVQREVVAHCREEGISIPEYVRRREAAIRAFGLGVA
jgi:DNA-binding transcriptional MerR regulator